jgi:hypothetical protein
VLLLASPEFERSLRLEALRFKVLGEKWERNVLS